MPRRCEIHGHRGARGLRPENTLAAFEAALDLGITVLELDLHLTRDGIPVVCHDPRLSPKLAGRREGTDVPDPATLPAIASLTLDQLHGYHVDRNPEPKRFPDQQPKLSPLVEWWGNKVGMPAWGVPTLGVLFEFVQAYAGRPGEEFGRTPEQRRRAGQVGFNIELKRDPKKPENIPDDFDGTKPGRFEAAVFDVMSSRRMLDRCIIQCFDWRVLPLFHALEPKLPLAALLDAAPPPDLEAQLAKAKATIYSPNHQRLTAELIRQQQAAGRRVIPYTVNDVPRMEQLLDWEVDGIITDFPDRLLRLVQARHLDY